MLNQRGFSPLPFMTKNARIGYPAAPRISSLPLLPLGPDGVRRILPRRTHPDTWVAYLRRRRLSITAQKSGFSLLKGIYFIKVSVEMAQR